MRGGREGRLHLREDRPHGLGGLNDVLARPLAHTQRDHGIPVETRVALPLLEAEVHCRHVAHVDRPVARGLDHDVLERTGVLELARHANEELDVADIDRAAGYRDVLERDRLDDVGERDAVVLELAQVHVHFHFALQAPGQLDAEHARYLLDLVLNVLGELLQPNQVVLARHVHLHDRELGKVELHDRRLLGRLRELGLRDVHFLPHELQGLRHVHSGLELGRDAGVAFHRLRGEGLDVGDLVELLLERSGDERLDVLRRDARIDRGHGHERDRDVRRRLFGDGEIRVQTTQNDQNEKRQDADRVIDSEVRQPERLVPAEVLFQRVPPLEHAVGGAARGEPPLGLAPVHAAPPECPEPAHDPLSSLTTLTLSPASTSWCPFTIRRSPSSRPAATTTSFSKPGPSSTRLASATVSPGPPDTTYTS